MTISTVTPSPPAPQSGTMAEAEFDPAADLFTAWMEDFVPDFNTAVGEMNADIATVNTQSVQVASDAAQTASDRQATEDIYAAIATEVLDSTGSSGSAVTIGTGAKSFTASAGKLWFADMAIILRSGANSANYMVGKVTSYNVSSGALDVTVYVTGGSGSHSDWLIYPAGQRYSGGLTQIGATVAASNVAAIDFSISSGYKEYELRFRNVIPATDNADLYVRTSTNGGSSFDSGGSDYHYQSSAGAQVPIAVGIGSDTNENGASGILRIINPHAAAYCQMYVTGVRVSTSTTPATLSGVGLRLAAADVDAVRLLFSSGNIESGEFTLYGVNT